MLEDRAAFHELAAMQRQVLDERILLRRELDRRSAARHGARNGVDANVAALECGCWRARSPANERAQTRHELVERKRLGEIIVCARVEQGDLVLDRVTGRQ